jgi:hypothetical protein
MTTDILLLQQLLAEQAIADGDGGTGTEGSPEGRGLVETESVPPGCPNTTLLIGQ